MKTRCALYKINLGIVKLKLTIVFYKPIKKLRGDETVIKIKSGFPLVLFVR